MTSTAVSRKPPAPARAALTLIESRLPADSFLLAQFEDFYREVVACKSFVLSHASLGSVEITDALRKFTTEKFSRLQRHYDRIISANVIFNVQKMIQRAEATLNVPGEPIYASSESDDLYSAIDLLVDKLDKQIKKHKEKTQDHRERE